MALIEELVKSGATVIAGALGGWLLFGQKKMEVGQAHAAVQSTEGQAILAIFKAERDEAKDDYEDLKLRYNALYHEALAKDQTISTLQSELTIVRTNYGLLEARLARLEGSSGSG